MGTGEFTAGMGDKEPCDGLATHPEGLTKLLEA